MTLRARDCGVRSGQRENGGAVIECRGQPGCGGMTLFAGLREPASYVVRVRRLLERGKVTSGALRWRSGKLAPNVTLRALHIRVRSGQREHSLSMVEHGVTP